MSNFREVHITIPDDDWIPTGQAGDGEDIAGRGVLGVVLVINGARHYLEAYEVHAGEPACDGSCETHIAPDVTHGAYGNAHAFDLLAEAHGTPARVQTLEIAGRTYAVFAEPAGA